MTSNQDVTLLTIRQLFDPSSCYIIPIYQRNYAWGAPEIEQLIQDIYDAAKGDMETEQYFLGSLVVYVRSNSAPSNIQTFETIDGQQRHTTLSILLAYLKNVGLSEQYGLDQIGLNLGFDSRPKSDRALDDLYLGHKGSLEEPSILSAYKVIDKYFQTKRIDGQPLNIDLFCSYLLDKVIILRVTVPHDTDLNHYFEIMNNRGEQLEKHEVLKARFMSEFGSDQISRDSFSMIWDACANMHRYVQLGFSTNLREALFDKNWRTLPSDFNAIKSTLETSPQDEPSDASLTLSQIIAGRKRHLDLDDDSEREQNERFGSVIDFSNFLLHVLKLTQDDSVTLDDKKLLDAFYDSDNQLKAKPDEFAFNLLKYRVLFDRFIIKRDAEEKWSLLTLNKYHDSFSYVNSFGTEDDLGLNQTLVMLLSMFHVSYPAQVYKRWLNSALSTLNELSEQGGLLHIDAQAYLEKLEQLSDQYFDETNPNEDALHQGTAVQNFIFNRLDYLLWKRLSTKEKFDGIGAEHLGKHFDEFQFSYRTSVEHYFPQTDPYGKVKMKDVNRFGNLCLISPSNNSKLSNYSPADKKKFYQEQNRAESLKQAIMMTYDEWGPDGNGLENIKGHEEAMVRVLYNQHS